MVKKLAGKFWGLPLILAVGLTGCAGGGQEIRQEIAQDRLDIRRQIEQQNAAYQKREDIGFSSSDSNNWNSTDWSMWMDTRGGGR